MTLPDIERVTRIIEEVAAEEMLPRFRTLAGDQIREKSGPGDLVTIVDEVCEKRLYAALTDLLPGSLVVGEEAPAADPWIMDRRAGEAQVVIIAPLAGNWQFAHGRDRFAQIDTLA